MRQAACDLAVVGQGAAGLAAALAAAEASPGARIVVLERASQSECGGGTRCSPSNLRANESFEIEPDFVDQMMKASGGRGDIGYFRRIEREAPEALRWLASHGVRFHSPGYYLSAAAARIQPVGGGAAIVERLTAAARQAGVEFQHQFRARKLLQDAAGGAAGVQCELAGGKTLSIQAGAVILASGGFQGSPAMLREHLGEGAESLQPISPGSAFNRGDGIRMALEAGAKRSGDWRGMHSEPVDPRSTGSAPVVLVYPYGIVVDTEGRRFFDEGRGLMHETWEDLSREIHFGTPQRKAWAILDSRLREIAGYERSIRSEVPPVEAGSIVELAALTRLPQAALSETLATYNAACTGDPKSFDAMRADGLESSPSLSPPKSNWARSIDRPPYLAWPLIGAIAYTFGGLATDDSAAVLGARGPIPGLYAAGEITAHFHGTAPNAVAILRALVFGRIAGRAAIISTRQHS